MRRSIKSFLIFLLGVSSCLTSNAKPLPKKHFFMAPPPTLPTVTNVFARYYYSTIGDLGLEVTVNTPSPRDVGVYYVVTYYDSPGLNTTRSEELYSVVFANGTLSSTADIQYTNFYGIKSWYVEFEDWE